MKTKSSLRFWKHVILAAFLLIVLNGVLEARLVIYSEARLAAMRLLEMENDRPDLRLTKDALWLEGIESLIYRNQQIAYLVKLKPQGFMILSDITEVSPQVFVSFSGDFYTLREHPFLMRILDHLQYNKIHLFYLDLSAHPNGNLGPEGGPDLAQIIRNEGAWSALLLNSDRTKRLTVGSSSANAVAPLLVSTWSQDSPFWNYTPRMGGRPTVTGCVATAMAQVMHFWEYPERGQGSHSYEWNNRTLYANFNHVYSWDLMKSSYSRGYSGNQADAVARLISDVGIAVNTQYGLDGSSAVVNANNAFVKYFKYSPDCYAVGFENWSDWFNMLKQQMDLRQPVIMGIFKPNSGHAVVADGYRISPSNQVHINMGWGGYADSYYTVSNIYGYGDLEKEYAEINIYPPKRMTLNIRSSHHGTTKPKPGVYSIAEDTNVSVTAIPAAHSAFINWSGSSTGTTNPLFVTMSTNKSILANFRYIYAPTASGTKVLNRSYSQLEYINILSWQASPANASLDITKYKIYLTSNGTYSFLAEVDANQSQYYHRKTGLEKRDYKIVAVHRSGSEGAPAFVTVQ